MTPLTAIAILIGFAVLRFGLPFAVTVGYSRLMAHLFEVR